jgi:LAO/AO transport system ATPase
MSFDIEKSIADIKDGSRKALRKTLSQIENFNEKDIEILIKNFLDHKHTAPFVGVLGNPGAGKSTFSNQLIRTLKGRKIGFLLIDPSSPLYGGALLGDRIRLNEHSLNKDIYMRSISNKGEASGLNPYLESYLMLYSLFPFDLILVEAVGSGQANTDLYGLVDHILLIYDPHSGDGIQHLKGGVLDIADTILLSKADLKGTEGIKKSLEESLYSDKLVLSSNLLDEKSTSEIIKTWLKTIKISDHNSLVISLKKKILKYFCDQKIAEFLNDSKDLNLLTECESQVITSTFVRFLKENT